MPIDLYYTISSPPCRAVKLTAKALGLDLNLKKLNLLAKEQMKPEYLAINPQHTVPTIVDGDITLWESRAICTYLASKYGKNDSLYPKDPKIRCAVDQWLYFDMGTLYQRLIMYFIPLLSGGQLAPEKLAKIEEALGWLNDVLKKNPWVAGSKMTVADFSLVATVSSIEVTEITDLSKFVHLQGWLEKCKKVMVGYDEVNVPGVKAFAEFIKSLTKK